MCVNRGCHRAEIHLTKRSRLLSSDNTKIGQKHSEPAGVQTLSKHLCFKINTRKANKHSRKRECCSISGDHTQIHTCTRPYRYIRV